MAGLIELSGFNTQTGKKQKESKQTSKQTKRQETNTQKNKQKNQTNKQASKDRQIHKHKQSTAKTGNQNVKFNTTREDEHTCNMAMCS